MTRFITKLYATCTLVLSIPCIGASQNLTGAASRIDSLLSTYADNAPGISLKVSQGGTVIYRKDIGMANLEYSIPITDSTIFEAGSVSKQFTATAILVLAQEGKLALDEPVRNYVPELPEYEQPITIRHLLNHTSGLKDWGALAGLGGWPRGTRQYTNALALDYIVNQPTLNHAPGEEYIYSNANYTLLTIIAERVSGLTLPEFTEKFFFKPLGMHHTSWRDDHRRVVKNRATAYGQTAESAQTNMPFENTYGHAALLTTIEDLERWNTSWGDTFLGQAGLIDLRTETGSLNDGSPITYASAVIVDKYMGHQRIYHTGSTAGYRALLTYYPTEDLSITMLSNNARTGTALINNELAAILFGKENTEQPVNTADKRDTPSINLSTIAPEIAGWYLSQACGGSVTLHVDHDTLRISWPNAARQPLALQPAGADTFDAENQQTDIKLVRDDSGAITGFYISEPRARNVWFERINADLHEIPE